MKMDHVYSIKFILCILGGIMVFAGLMNILYSYTIIRYALVLAYGSVFLYFVYKYRDRIKKVLLKKG